MRAGGTEQVGRSWWEGAAGSSEPERVGRSRLLAPGLIKIDINNKKVFKKERKKVRNTINQFINSSQTEILYKNTNKEE